MTVPDPILYPAAAARGRELAARWRGQVPFFGCVLAHTDTCLIPGLSAAGVSGELLAYTPAADAEAIVYGAPRSLPGLPTHPLGPPGPAGITRAAARLAKLPVAFYAAGLRVWPDVPYTRVECAPGGRIDRGRAVPEARQLFARGGEIGRGLVGRGPYVVLGESVPGGTTTALALLLALGIAADGRISGSQRGNAHGLKSQTVQAAMMAAGLEMGGGRGDPLGAAAALGDPMQPLTAGIAAALAEREVDVLLAGGSQMVAVAALLAAVRGRDLLRRVALGTTRWVIEDPHADVAGLAGEVSPDLPLLAINLDFSHARHAPLRAYEQSLVKEGAGAGGACLAAILATGMTIHRLQAAIDDAYEPSGHDDTVGPAQGIGTLGNSLADS